MASGVRITQRELARKLGLSQATVSRALAGGARHSEETRGRILATAAELGYRPDPVLACLNAYRRTRRPIARGASLAWFGATPPSEASYERTLFLAARRRAEALGYGLEYHWERRPGYSARRFEQIFAARGIAGVIFGPRPEPYARVELEITPFAAVAMGRSVGWPPVDLVSTDHFQTMELCFRRLAELGHHRIGFSLTRGYNERVAGLWRGSYLNQQTAHPGLSVLPPFQEAEQDGEEFDRWLNACRPDAIITMAGPAGCLGALRRRKIRAPRDLGLALLVLPEEEAEGRPRHAGIVEPTGRLAELAVDVVVGRIRNNERGTPAPRRVHLLPGEWRDGPTTRRL
jgi:Transcriptional regulators